MFQRILKCDFEFVSPWWDDTSLSAKVTTKLIKFYHLLREPPSILIKYKRTVTPNNIFIALLNLRFDYILVIVRTDWCKITIASIYIVKMSLMSLKYDQFF